MYQSIRPGKIWLDTNGKRIQAHGGSILFANGKFWWYGENKEGITGRATGENCPYWHHGVKLYSSTDLYNWTDEGFAVKESDDENNPFHPTRIMDRPHILFNEKTKKYVLWAKTAQADFGKCGFSVCVGDDLHSFVFLHEFIPTPHVAGDFDLFVKDGKAYVVYESPHVHTVLQELTEDYTNVTDTYSIHQPYGYPPYIREAASYFHANGRDFLLTSGTTGYYPNGSQIDDITPLHGEWKALGNACVKDKNRNSFHAQFSSVFKHPTIEGLYIALGDRWLTDLPHDLPDMDRVFLGFFSKKHKKTVHESELPLFTDENTSEANYVWLPITFNKKGVPQIHWTREWKIEDFQK